MSNMLYISVETTSGKSDVIEVELWEPKTPQDYLELVLDISINYDGYNDVKNLKELIDEMRLYVIKARKLIE